MGQTGEDWGRLGKAEKQGVTLEQTGNKEVLLGQTGEDWGRQWNEMKTKDRLEKTGEGWVTGIT